MFEHIGMYAYRRDFVFKYASLPQTPLEKLESLEQLRVLEHGYRLRVVETRQDYIPLSVDTQEDLQKARTLARKLERDAARGGRDRPFPRPLRRLGHPVHRRRRGSLRGAPARLLRLPDRPGISGLFAFGTTGEWPLLTEAEHTAGARVLAQQARGRVPVIVHAGAHGTEQAVRLALGAREAGADAVSLISPPFFPLDEEALLRHFTAVARAVAGFPVFLYNIPEYAGNDLSPALCCAWSGRRTT